MGRHESGQTSVADRRLEAVEQAVEPGWTVDVLLPVGAHQEVALRLKLESCKHVRSLDRLTVHLQDLSHRGARLEDAPRVESLGEEVAPGVLGVDQVEVGDVVYGPAIRLL